MIFPPWREKSLKKRAKARETAAAISEAVFPLKSALVFRDEPLKMSAPGRTDDRPIGFERLNSINIFTHCIICICKTM
jgi:hypothetical protein